MAVVGREGKERKEGGCRVVVLVGVVLVMMAWLGFLVEAWYWQAWQVGELWWRVCVSREC